MRTRSTKRATVGVKPLRHRGIDVLAMIAGGVSALPLAAIIAMTVHLVQ